MDKRIAHWLASGDTGTSSKAIMLWLSAREKRSVWGASTPSDPADLGRCLRLLERIPEWKARMPEMAAAGGYWPTFARRWDEMADSMIEECGGKVPGHREHFSCPRTYELMKQVRHEARTTDSADFHEVSLDGKLAGFTMRVGK